MKKATIKIEVVGDGRVVNCNTDLQGEILAIMIGLANAIKELETQVPEKDRADYRARILGLLNDRH